MRINMLMFKKVDWVVQATLIGGTLLLMALSPRSRSGFFYFYFVVGGWQLLSVLVHLLSNVKFRNILRTIYLRTLCVVLGLGILSLIISNMSIYFFLALLYISPLMAILYLATCYRETRQMGSSLA